MTIVTVFDDYLQMTLLIGLPDKCHMCRLALLFSLFK
jgi:hypothetical protein